MTKEKPGCAAPIAGLVAMGIIIVGGIFEGLVATKLWTWMIASYVAPWHIPAPTMLHWIGLDMLATLLFKSRDAAKKDEAQTESDTLLRSAFTRAIMTPLAVLGIAFLVTKVVS